MSSPTGETKETTAVEFQMAAYLSLTRAPEARSDYYDVPYSRSLKDRRPRIMGNLHAALGSPATERRNSHYKMRYAFRVHIKRAIEAASQMVTSAVSGEPLELARAGVTLDEELGELWKLRAIRDKSWAKALNFVHGAVTAEHFERFSKEQCVAVRQMVTDYLAHVTINTEDVRVVRTKLQDVGLDPWRPLSPLEEGNDDD